MLMENQTQNINNKQTWRHREKDEVNFNQLLHANGCCSTGVGVSHKHLNAPKTEELSKQSLLTAAALYHARKYDRK